MAITLVYIQNLKATIILIEAISIKDSTPQMKTRNHGRE